MSETDYTIRVIIEIPRGSRNKYECDPSTGAIRLDRVLFSSVHYPTEYGFVPKTIGEDGDPLDVLVIIEEPTFPGCQMEARPIGVLHMTDEAGLDDKILCVCAADPRFDGVRDITDIEPHWLREIENFFRTYKMLEEKETSLQGWGNREEATKVVREAMRAGSAQG